MMVTVQLTEQHPNEWRGDLRAIPEGESWPIPEFPDTSDGLGSASPAPAVTRAAAVLEALAASATGRLTLSDLARELGIPKSSTSNLLLALEEARLINRQGAEFTLGRKLVELGAAYLSRLDEVQEFYRFCEQAPTLSGETVRIAMLDGTNVIYLARYEGHPAVRLTSNIGDKMPVSLCAVGKALIARLHDHDVAEMFPDDAELPVLTPKSLRTGSRAQGPARRHPGAGLRLRGRGIHHRRRVPGRVRPHAGRARTQPGPVGHRAEGDLLGRAGRPDGEGTEGARPVPGQSHGLGPAPAGSGRDRANKSDNTLASRSPCCTLFNMVIDSSGGCSLSHQANGGLECS